MARNGRNYKPNGTISARQDRVAACLAAGRTNIGAARECKVGINTIYVWLRQPEFRARIEELRHQLVDGAIGRLAEMMAGSALDRLSEMLEMVDEEKRGGQLAAVKAAFELFIQTTNAAELKSRLEALEAASKGTKK